MSAWYPSSKPSGSNCAAIVGRILPASAAMWADPVVTRHFGKSFTEEESWTRFLRYVGHWAMLGFGYWVVEEKATGTLPERSDSPTTSGPFSPQLNAAGNRLGACLAIPRQGLRHGGRTRRCAWGDSTFRLIQTTCIIHPENLSSIRVAEKCGYGEFQRTNYKGHPTMMFVRQRHPLPPRPDLSPELRPRLPKSPAHP